MDMKNKKILSIAVFLLLIAVSIFVFKSRDTFADTHTTYYSGEAVFYKNKIIIGTINSGRAEIFTVKEGKIEKVSQILPQSEEKEFNDLIFNQTEEDLYLYLTNGRYFYQYNISSPKEPLLAKKLKDNSWDWFKGLEKKGEYVITLGSQGTKIWNQDLQNISSYLFPENEYQYNINFFPDEGYVLNLDKKGIEVYNPVSGQKTAQKDLRFEGDHFRKAHYDSEEGIYVVDDNSLKKYGINNSAEKLDKKREFKHISEHGYDVDGLKGSGYIYFSDGVGVVKADKYSLNPVDWIFTTGVGEAGSWAQGIRVVQTNKEEAIVVFNLNNILVLNKDMEVIDHYDPQEEPSQIKRKFYLKLNTKEAVAGEQVTLTGGGFANKEKIIIEYLQEKVEVWADEKGKFSQELIIPSQVSPSYISIRAEGEKSGLYRGISLKIRD